jgi:aspartyl/asparaginyl beta-hydroxylase (cupin superfamily)
MTSRLLRRGLLQTTAAQRPCPSLFCYPGLTAAPFWDPARFPVVAALMERLDVVRAEYAALAAAQPAGDYVVADGEHTLHSGSWAWHSLVTRGAVNPAATLACPETARLLLHRDLLADGVPFAYAFFSTLRPGASIAPHFGPANIRLRVHVPLDVPSDDPAELGIAVAGETRGWGGGPLVFDDSFEHSTWNRTGRDRVVLLFDLWHPDLSPAEREGVVRMFDGARRAGWLT